MERSFNNFNDNNLKYLKQKLMENYSTSNSIISRTNSILVNTFIRLGGIDLWPDLLEFLINKLNFEEEFESSLESIHLIVEDCGTFIEDKNSDVKK